MIGPSSPSAGIFAQRLIALLAQPGWDRQRWRVACDAGISPKRLQRLCTEFPLHGPTLAEVEALARILGVRPAWLVGWSA